MKKTDYIIRQIKKSYYKKYENYVVTRIWHLINNLDIKFVTQQHVTRPSGRALTDIYFPQFQLHIEIDEPSKSHFDSGGKQVERDIVRQRDIINATKHSLKRINCCGDIKSINNQIDAIVDFINKEIESNNFVPWDLEAEYNPQTYINKGSISAQDDVAFLTIADACNCFGHSYKGYQRGGAKHPYEDRIIWFPKLYENKDWENEITFEEDIIYEKKKVGHKEYFEIAKSKPGNLKEKIAFAHAKNNLGITMYRFKGVYKLNIQESEAKGKFVYFKTPEQIVKTYSSK